LLLRHWFLRLLPSHLYCLCYRTCISGLQGVLGNGGASDLDIPGTMSLESVGVLKLQVCSGQLISGAGQTAANANGCTVGVLEAQERLSTGGASGIGVFGCRAARQEVCISGHEGTVMLGAAPQLPSSCTSTPAEAF
jgi:hypothetical protein